MNYFIRYNNQTTGPFAEQQIVNFLQQGRFDDSVRFSADLTRWYPPREISAFRNIPLQQSPSSGSDARPLRNTTPGTRRNAAKDHSVLFFLGFCLVVILGFAAAIYAINQDDPEDNDDSAPPVETANSLPAVYQKKQRAIGLVTITFQDKEGSIKTFDIGTAFAIGKNKFVTNAHVAYAVKNGFEKQLITPWLITELNERAEKNGMSGKAYAQKIGERGIAQIRTEILEQLKEARVHVRDVEIRLSHSGGESFRVAKVQVHPRYDPNGKPTGEFDVAVFETVGETDCYFDVASQRELYGLKPGTPIASAGFPTEGLLENPLDINKPEAFYASGDIRRISNFENRDGGDKNNKSITHSIPAAGGASGSPIFTANGKVVAVLWGGDITVNGLGERTPSAALRNFAVRIDQIKTMTEAVPWDSWVNDPTK